ncbi:MAG: methyltransferase domain-containing protein [Alphaproteobacteria bacterium]|nr:methyltransferase domain-containing protein [Alphaproteobacteria bacterium]
MAQAAQKDIMDKETKAAYDSVPYESYAYPMTFPRHTGMVASLFGIPVTPPEKARILEIGSAAGGNVFPIALQYPSADITAIDLSAVQIAQAQKQQEAMGVKNIRFIAMDVCNIDKSFGQFDYIICHGVFSWVPDQVRDRILEICRDRLTDNGVAFISYNTLPGWQFVQSLRDMMRYHIERFATPREKVTQARALLEFLRDSAPSNREWYKNIIQEELNIVSKANDSYFFHDHLEGNNTQYYLHQFVEMARKHNLQYLGDTNLPSMFVENMPKEAVEKLRSVNDIVRQEQYMDFIINRRFRMSLVVKDTAKIVRQIPQDKIFDFYLSTAMKPKDAKANLENDFAFEKLDGGGLFTTHNLQSAALFTTLYEHGARPVHADALIKEVAKKLAMTDDTPLRKILSDYAIKLALHGYINLSTDTISFTKEISAKPEIYPLARYQAQQPSVKIVTSLNGSALPVDAIGGRVIACADGKNTLDDIVRIITQDIKTGKLQIQQNGKPILNDAEIKQALETVIRNVLGKCADNALLVA